MDHYVWSTFFFLQILVAGAEKGRRNSGPQDSIMNSVSFKILLETLIKADDDLTAKTHALQRQNDELEHKLKFIEETQPTWQQKCSDEISDLKIKLASSGEACQKHTAALTEKITELEGILVSAKQSFVDKLKGFKSEIAQYNANQMVSFSARIYPSYSDIAAWETIKFSQIETNIGNAYNTNTGEFTAPRAGLYVFYCNILSRIGGSIEAGLQVNGQNKFGLYSAGTSSYFGSGSNMLVVYLKRRDKVKMVKYGPWGTKPFYIHHAYSTFSGFLLRSDT